MAGVPAFEVRRPALASRSRRLVASHSSRGALGIGTREDSGVRSERRMPAEDPLLPSLPTKV